MSKSLQGRVTLITGGGSGIGRAAARQFADQGARVVIGDLAPETAEETARILRDSGSEALASRVDVTDEASVRAFIAFTLDAYGRIDCAFNNAGVLGPLGDMHECSLADYERVMAVNVRGVWLCMQAQITAMLAQQAPHGGHSIVNTASVAGLVGLTRAAARSYGRRGIRVNCVCPGPIETPLAGPLFGRPGNRELMLARQALGQFGEPEEVASAVVWLSSPAASLVTGTPFRVDAGALS